MRGDGRFGGCSSRDGHRDDGRHFIIHTDELLTAYVELEIAVCWRCCLNELLESRSSFAS